MPTLPRQHLAANCCTKNHLPIGVTVHSQCVETFEGLLRRCMRGRGCSELCKKQNFSWTPFNIGVEFVTCDLKMNHNISINQKKNNNIQYLRPPTYNRYYFRTNDTGYCCFFWLMICDYTSTLYYNCCKPICSLFELCFWIKNESS